MRAELEALMRQWVLDGHKNEVETARSQVQALGARSPWLTWDEWKKRCDPELDVLSAPEDTSTVFTSAYTPANATADGAWQSFTLEAAEIERLLSEAPASWRARLPSGGNASNAVEFEFSSAGVMRSWFDADLFKARFWRFDDARQVSNGASPPAGECPAYVAGVVFARHVRERAVAGAPATAGPANEFKGFEFALAKEGLRMQTKAIPTIALASQVAAVSPRKASLTSTAALNKAIEPRVLTATRAVSTTAKVRAPAVTKATLQLTDPKLSVQLAKPQLAAIERMREGSVQRVLLDKTAVKPPKPNPAPTAPTPAAPPDDTIYILAFICKPVPLSPNPDPQLTW